MAYARTTWGQMKTALFGLLGNNVFWSDSNSTYPEITAYLTEAMRVWAAMAHYWHQRVTFVTAANTPWYDLTTITTSPANIFNFSVLDRSLLAEIQYHLLEPISYTTWGSEQFTFTEVIGAIERRRDQFLMETACRVGRNLLSPVVPSAEGRFEIPVDPTNSQPAIDVRRLAWLNGDGKWTQLWRDDEFAFTSLNPDWNTTPQPDPVGFSVSLTPPLNIQFLPAPTNTGSLDFIGVYAGKPVNTTAGGVPIGVPDNFSWAVKWGALADLLGKEGPGRDNIRAAYCEERWKDAVELSRMYSWVLMGQIRGQTILSVDSVQSLDAVNPTWQNSSGPPENIGLVANLAGLAPVPDGQYGVTIDALIPAPIPVADSDFVQLGPEELDAVLSMAQHIASFKQGGSDFQATLQQYSEVTRLAAEHNEELRASALYARQITDRQTKEVQARPYRRPGEALRI